MIISDKYKYVYVSIPKTGTLSVRTWLRKYYEGIPLKIFNKLNRHAPRHPGMGYHSHNVPDVCKDYLIFTTVRNPYARAYSAYKFERFKGEFLKYLTMLPTRRHRANPNMFHTQTHFIQESGATHIIRLENLSSILELPFVDKTVMPDHLRKSSANIKPPYEKYYNEEEHQALLDYCEEDFETFGYDKIY